MCTCPIIIRMACCSVENVIHRNSITLTRVFSLAVLSLVCVNVKLNSGGLSMSEIKPIQTIYNGYHFRSRLEARWAVFFDALNIKYEYEPEGYVLPNGTCYLPDFRIYVRHRDYKDEYKPIFVEVKGTLTKYDVFKIDEFAYRSNFKYPTLIVGNVPKDTHEALNNINTFQGEFDFLYYTYSYIDGDWAYPCFFTYHGGEMWLAGPDHNELSYNTYFVDQALLKARQARFEHGETPKIRKGELNNVGELV